jgi:hypothetical protein
MVGLCALAVLTVSPAAIAKRGYFAFPGHRESSLTLKGTMGYEIAISADDRFIGLEASGNGGVALYLVKALGPPGEKIEATFPGLGRVAVEFHPSQAARHTHHFFPDCHGGAGTIQRGVFRGTIKFRGEEGFTEVSASRARGRIESSSREICPRNDHDTSTGIAVGGDSIPGYLLEATERSRGRELNFSAIRGTSGSALDGETWFTVYLAEIARETRIIRIASATAQAASLSVAGDPRRPSSASVRPPAPFRGTAAFQGTGTESTWEGTLAIDLPGARDLELTGPSFRSSLCLNKSCVGIPRR